MEGLEGLGTAILVEGESDRAALLALARLRGLDPQERVPEGTGGIDPF